MKKKFFTRIFWFALGSIIALFVLACDVNADTFNYYDTLSINNVYDQILCSNNNSNLIQCYNSNGLMYGKATKNYTFVKGSIYTVSFTSNMEYYAIHGQIQTSEIRQNGILFWNSTHTSFQYASCIANTSTYITQEIDIDTLHVDTTYTCATTMNDNFTSFDYINQSSAYNWIGAKLSMSSVEINSIAEGNAGIIENANNNQQQTNDRLDKIDDTLTQNDMPNTEGFADDYAGYLPAGPLDVAINMPKTLLLNLKNSLSQTCEPISLSIPFLPTNEKIRIPCLNTLYSRISGLNILINFISYCAMGLIFFRYAHFLSVVKDSILTLSFDDLASLENPYKRGKI